MKRDSYREEIAFTLCVAIKAFHVKAMVSAPALTAGCGETLGLFITA